MADTFLLTNKIGGYCMLSPRPRSAYEGVFFLNGTEMYKFIDQIRIPAEQKSLVYNYWNVQRFYDNCSERIVLPHSYNSLIWQADSEIDFDLVLDARRSYDSRKWGKEYIISEEKGCLVITFIKRTSYAEDATEGDEEFRMYLAVKGVQSHEILGSWEKVEYPYDSMRTGMRAEAHVYAALRLKAKNAVFCFGFDKERVMREAHHVYQDMGRILKKQHKHIEALLSRAQVRIPVKTQSDAYKASVVAIDSLTAVLGNDEGLFAGLPWFFQFWTRDEAISLRSLMISGNLKKAENILLRMISELRHDGRLPNRFPSADLGSADGVGWAFVRTADLFDYIERFHVLKQFMSRRLKNQVITYLERAICLTAQSYEKEGLIWNAPKETWMDTDFGGDTRAGFRIEIQALFLAMLKLAYRLSGEREWLGRELSLRERVKAHFVSGRFLLDGVGDPKIRPNLFLACYIYPNLLAGEEWESAFDAVLPELYSGWGGVSSIGKSDPLYCPAYIAKDDQSYHRGDSWYWVNNLVAIVLNRVNKEKYKGIIETIAQASAKEISEMGIIGYHAELSPAEVQGSTGSLAQTWSSALYIELMHELYR